MDFVALMLESVDHLTDEYVFWFALWSIVGSPYEPSRTECEWWAVEPRRVAALLNACAFSGLMAFEWDTRDLRVAVHTDVDKACWEVGYTLGVMRRRQVWLLAPP